LLLLPLLLLLLLHGCLQCLIGDICHVHAVPEQAKGSGFSVTKSIFCTKCCHHELQSNVHMNMAVCVGFASLTNFNSAIIKS